MDDHAGMAEEWVQSIPILWREQDAIRRFESIGLDALKRLIELVKRVLEKHAHPNKERQRDAGNNDHPRQEFAVAVPFAERDQKGEGSHQPGPEEKRTS